MTLWEDRIDPYEDKQSRWHSLNINLVRTRDLLGDTFVSELREAARDHRDQRLLVAWSNTLRTQLEEYEAEERLLIKLATTGRVVKILQGAIKQAVEILKLHENASDWIEELSQEREARIDLYETLSKSNFCQLAGEVQDENQQLEVLTVLKHGLEKHGDVLTPRELDMISAVFDWVVRLSGIVIGPIPEWFTVPTFDLEWSFSGRSSTGDDGEEGCLRQVAIWSKLHHPHVRRFYGACHVGGPFVVHGASDSLRDRVVVKLWEILHGCALGLQYVHERGLVHQSLSAGTLHRMTQDGVGVLSGLGLQSLREVGPASSTLYSLTSNTNLAASDDIKAFGLAILEILSIIRMADDDDDEELVIYMELPSSKPDFLADWEWTLVCGMCAGPAERVNMTDVVHALEYFAHSHALAKENEALPREADKHVDAYEFPLAGQTIPDIFDQASELYDQEPEFADMNRLVFDRLNDIYQQLKEIDRPVATNLLEDYSSILWRFLIRLEHQEAGGYSETATLCASRTLANRNYGLQHDIDRLIFKHHDLKSATSVHDWKLEWQRIQRIQCTKLDACIQNPSEFLLRLNSKTEKSEAAALVEYETGRPLITGNCALPRWFIPPYQVELEEHIADGSYGSVYRGKWLGTDVVVKQVLTDQSDPVNREQFRREVNLWYSLSHLNLITLYGACHEGQPFFVCERATQGTLVSFAKGEDRTSMWIWLWRTASALGYLHDNGVVHGDLKGNNILVDEDGIETKLADFGLSFLPSVASDNQEVGTGAARWKAPECLLGARPTFASDIYSFGMCIIEVITGEYPWGLSMADETVKYKVAMKKQLPVRPAMLEDEEWALVERMCCYNPEQRITAGMVVSIADYIRGEWEKRLQ